MWHETCPDHAVFVELVVIDQALADDARALGCPACGAALHTRNFQRKPRGGLMAAAGEAFCRRFGLCCSREGCRRSVLPPSFRFLGRRVYLEAVVVLACMQVLLSGMRCIAPVASVPVKTIRRWLSWWTLTLPASPTWQWIRGRLMPPVDEMLLPRSFVERVVEGLGAEPDIGQVLTVTGRWLAPLTTQSMNVQSLFARGA